MNYMSIKEKFDTIFENADKFADGRRAYCLFLSFFEKIIYKNATVNFFLLKLYEKNFYERRKYLSEKDKCKLESLNDADISLLQDKEKFNIAFKDKIGRDYIYPAHSTYNEFVIFCKKHPAFIVKTNWTAQGSGIYKYRINENSDLKDLFKKFSDEYVMLEEIIVQHEELNKLNSSSVNTVRVATLLKNNKVNIVAAALRIGNGDVVDNLHGGGFGCSVDVETGIVKSLGFDGIGNGYIIHPVSKAIIPGFQVPNWDTVISTVTEAAQRVSQFKWIGWDVAVTESGAVLIEGNHNQGIDLIQIGNDGLKPDIKAILNN